MLIVVKSMGTYDMYIHGDSINVIIITYIATMW